MQVVVLNYLNKSNYILTASYNILYEFLFVVILSSMFDGKQLINEENVPDV